MKNLINQKKILITKIAAYDDIIKGSIYEMKRFCGKPNCKCAKENTPHTSMFLSFKYNGKTNLIPIKKEQINEIKERIKKYHDLKKYIDKLAKINSELLRYKP